MANRYNHNVYTDMITSSYSFLTAISFKFKMIKYFLAPNQLVTGPTWVAKQPEMTQGFSPPDGKPVAVCCLKQTLATGDFHQLCGLPLKVCNNIAFNSPNFFLMSVRHPSTD